MDGSVVTGILWRGVHYGQHFVVCIGIAQYRTVVTGGGQNRRRRQIVMDESAAIIDQVCGVTMCVFSVCAETGCCIYSSHSAFLE